MKNIISKIILLIFFMSIAPLTSCGSADSDTGGGNSGEKPASNDFIPKAGNDLYGQITNDAGQGIQGVVVSDGYTCVATNTKGFYEMKRNSSAHFVFYSIPKQYKQKSAEFYKPLSEDIKRYDFKLETATVNDNHFYLVAIADPQVRSDESYRRFRNEGFEELKTFVSTSALPVLGITLGDVCHEACPSYMTPMRNLLNSLSMPCFSVIGNHDYFQVNDSKTTPRSSDTFEKSWGPTWYSFNKGNVHFIAINNVKYSDGTSYKGAISPEQIAWMKHDLSYVDKNQLIVVYYHIPIRDDKNYEGRSEMLNLLADYPNRILMCGHTHYMRNYVTQAPLKVEERIHAAACGAFWHSTINGDGTPNGFSVYEINGNQIVNNWYQSVRQSKDYQIRLLHGDAQFGGPYGTYTYGLSSDYVVANVWNWDYRWKVYCYEDGILSGEMMNSLDKFHLDAWACGYHIGVLQRAASDFEKYTMHDFIYKLKNPAAKVKVVATDGYGHTYTQNAFTTDFSEAKEYK